MWRLMFVGLLIVAPSAQTFAWGDDGHRIVCEIAFLEMAPATRAEVEALIATDQQGPAISVQWGLGADRCRHAHPCTVPSIDRSFAAASLATARAVSIVPRVGLMSKAPGVRRRTATATSLPLCKSKASIP